MAFKYIWLTFFYSSCEILFNLKHSLRGLLFSEILCTELIVSNRYFKDPPMTHEKLQKSFHLELLYSICITFCAILFPWLLCRTFACKQILCSSASVAYFSPYDIISNWKPYDYSSFLGHVYYVTMVGLYLQAENKEKRTDEPLNITNPVDKLICLAVERDKREDTQELT